MAGSTRTSGDLPVLRAWQVREWFVYGGGLTGRAEQVRRRAEFDEWLNDARARAWDQGYDQGRNQPSARIHHNPYRIAQRVQEEM